MDFPQGYYGENSDGDSGASVRAILSRTSENMKRLLEERNAVLYEYSRVMAERDTVHREIDQLQDDLNEANDRYKKLKTDYDQQCDANKKLEHQVEALKIEIASALNDRDVALKELHDKCFPERRWTCTPSGSWSKCPEPLKDNSVQHLRQEVDQLKRHLQKARDDLEEARQEARMSEKRRDWALNERDLAYRERDSFRIFCDEMRKERDRALSDMARILRNSDDIQRQLQQTFMEMKDLRRQLVEMQLETRIDQECRSNDRSDDSAVGSADLTVDEAETVEVELDCSKGRDATNLGFALAGGTDPGLYVVSVTNGGSAEGKLKINDRILKVGDVSCTSSNSETVWNVLKTAEKSVVLTLRRQKKTLAQCLYSVKLESGSEDMDHGLTLENGLYIQSVAAGSAAARSHLRSGDRVYSINGRTIDSIGSRTAYQLLDNAFKHSGGLVITVFRGSLFPSTLPMLPSPPGCGAIHSENRSASPAKTICSSPTDVDREVDAIAALEDVIDSYNPPHSVSSCDPNKATSGRQWTRGGLYRRSEALADMSHTASQKHNATRSWPRRRNSDLSQLFNACNHPRTRWPLSVFLDAFKTSAKSKVEEPIPCSDSRKMSNDHSQTNENAIGNGILPTSRLSANALQARSSSITTPTSYGTDWTSRSEKLLSGTSRIRFPPNSSLPSAIKYTGRISAGSSELTSRRHSLVPNYRVEIIGPKRSDANQNQRQSLTDAADRPTTEEVRRISINRYCEPLGVQFFSDNNGGGVFVSSVHRASLAAQVGLRVGDQVLEVCGINVRTATWEQAAHILRHCGDTLTLLVQYNPDKYYQEVQGLGDYRNRGLRIGSPSLTLQSDSALSNERSSVDRLPDEESRASSKDTVSPVERQMRSSLNCHREPRTIHLSTKNSYGLSGISLVGGNRVGIYIHSVEANSLAFEAGLRAGDRILEFNGVDLRDATAERAAYELGKSAENVKMTVLSDPERHQEIADQPGDGFYIRAQFDRQVSSETNDQQVDHLPFRRHDILYVDNTMFNGVPGQWRAWLIDEHGKRTKCGLIPSRYKADEEDLQRPSFKQSAQESEPRRSLPRRSFLRWKFRFSRTSWRDSKDISNYPDGNLQALATAAEAADPQMVENSPSIRRSYIRVDRLNRRQVKRPVLIIGPLSDWVVEQLASQFPDKFTHGASDMLRTAQPSTASSPMKLHPTWAMGPSSSESLEFLFHHNIHPIVVFIKFKSAKQICRLADNRSVSTKPVTGKAAKEMFQWALQVEAQRKHLFTVVILVSDGLADIGTRIKSAVKQEQRRILWITQGPVT